MTLTEPGSTRRRDRSTPGTRRRRRRSVERLAAPVARSSSGSVWTVMVVVDRARCSSPAGSAGGTSSRSSRRAGPASRCRSRCSTATRSIESCASGSRRRGSSSTPSVFTWYVERNGGLELVPGYYQLRQNDHMGNVVGHAAHAARPDLRQGHVPGGLHDRSRWPTGSAEVDQRLTADRVPRRGQLDRPCTRPPPAGRDVARRAAVPRHVPGVERRQRGPGRRADGDADGARRHARRTSRPSRRSSAARRTRS